MPLQRSCAFESGVGSECRFVPENKSEKMVIFKRTFQNSSDLSLVFDPHLSNCIRTTMSSSSSSKIPVIVPDPEHVKKPKSVTQRSERRKTIQRLRVQQPRVPRSDRDTEWIFPSESSTPPRARLRSQTGRVLPSFSPTNEFAAWRLVFSDPVIHVFLDGTRRHQLQHPQNVVNLEGPEDIRRFCLAVLAMGLVSLPEIRSHFSQSTDIYSSPMVKNFISRDLFLSIFSHIHVDVEEEEALEEEEEEEGSDVEESREESGDDEFDNSDDSEESENSEEGIVCILHLLLPTHLSMRITLISLIVPGFCRPSSNSCTWSRSDCFPFLFQSGDSLYTFKRVMYR